MTKLNKQYMGVVGDGSPVLNFHEPDKWTYYSADITNSSVSAIQDVWNGEGGQFDRFEPDSTYEIAFRPGYEAEYTFLYDGVLDVGQEVFFRVSHESRYIGSGGSYVYYHDASAITQPNDDPHNGQHATLLEGDFMPQIENNAYHANAAGWEPWPVVAGSTYYWGTAAIQISGTQKYVTVKIKHDISGGKATRNSRTDGVGLHLAACTLFTKLDGMTDIREAWEHPGLPISGKLVASWDLSTSTTEHDLVLCAGLTPDWYVSSGTVNKGGTFKIRPIFKDREYHTDPLKHRIKWKILNAPDNSTWEKRVWWVDAVLENYPLVGTKASNPKAHPDDPDTFNFEGDDEYTIKVRDELHPAVDFAPEIGWELEYKDNSGQWFSIGTFPQDAPSNTVGNSISIPANQITVSTEFNLTVDGITDTEAPFEIDEGTTGTITVKHRGIRPTNAASFTAPAADGAIGTDLTITDSSIYTWSVTDSLDMTDLISTWTFDVTPNYGADEGDAETDETKFFSWAGYVEQSFTIKDTFKSPSVSWHSGNSMYNSLTGHQYIFEEKLEDNTGSGKPQVVFTGTWGFGTAGPDFVVVVRELLPTGPGQVVYGSLLSRNSIGTTLPIELKDYSPNVTSSEGWPAQFKWMERYKALDAGDKEYANRYVVQFYAQANNDPITDYQAFLGSAQNAGQLGDDLDLYSYGVSALTLDSSVGLDEGFVEEGSDFAEINWVFSISKNPAETVNANTFGENAFLTNGSDNDAYASLVGPYGVDGVVQWWYPDLSDTPEDLSPYNAPPGVSLVFPESNWWGTAYNGWLDAQSFRLFHEFINYDPLYNDPNEPSIPAHARVFYKYQLKFKFNVDNVLNKYTQFRFLFVDSAHSSSRDPVWLAADDFPTITEAEYSLNDISFVDPPEADRQFHANNSTAFDMTFDVNYKTANPATEKTEFKITQTLNGVDKVVYVNRNVTDGWAPNGIDFDNVTASGQTYWQFWSVSDPAEQDKNVNWVGSSDGSIWPTSSYWGSSNTSSNRTYKIEPAYESSGLVVPRTVYDSKTFAFQPYNNVSFSYNWSDLNNWVEGQTHAITVTNNQTFPVTVRYQLSAGSTGVTAGSTNNVVIPASSSLAFNFSMPVDSTQELTDRSGLIYWFVDEKEKANITFTATAEPAETVDAPLAGFKAEDDPNAWTYPYPYYGNITGMWPGPAYASHPMWGSLQNIPTVYIKNPNSESRTYKVQLVRGEGDGNNNNSFTDHTVCWTFDNLVIGAGQETVFDTFAYIENTWWGPIDGSTGDQAKWTNSAEGPDPYKQYRLWWKIIDVATESDAEPVETVLMPTTEPVEVPMAPNYMYGMTVNCPEARLFYVGSQAATGAHFTVKNIQYLYKYLHEVVNSSSVPYEFPSVDSVDPYGPTVNLDDTAWPVKDFGSQGYFCLPNGVTKIESSLYLSTIRSVNIGENTSNYGFYAIDTNPHIPGYNSEDITMYGSWEVNGVMHEQVIRKFTLPYLKSYDPPNNQFIWLDTPDQLNEGDSYTALAYSEYPPDSYAIRNASTFADASDRLSVNIQGIAPSYPGFGYFNIEGLTNTTQADDINVQVSTYRPGDGSENINSNAKFTVAVGDTTTTSTMYGIDSDLEGGGGPGQAVTSEMFYDFGLGSDPSLTYPELVRRSFSSRSDSFQVGYSKFRGDMGHNMANNYTFSSTSQGYPWVWQNFLVGKFMIQMSWNKDETCDDLGAVLWNRGRSFDTNPTSAYTTHPAWSWYDTETWGTYPKTNGDFGLFFHINCTSLKWGSQQTHSGTNKKVSLVNSDYTMSWIIDTDANTVEMELRRAKNDWDRTGTLHYNDSMTFNDTNYPGLGHDWTLYLGDDTDGTAATYLNFYGVKFTPL